MISKSIDDDEMTVDHSEVISSMAKSDSNFKAFDRAEVARILIQSLYDLGYKDSATTLENESGYKIETSQVGEFRRTILNGEWELAEKILEDLEFQPDVSLDEMRFMIRRQEYLELLESGDGDNALIALRSKLTPLKCREEERHDLAKVLMFAPDEIRQYAKWDSTDLEPRSILLESLLQHVSPMTMIPPHRLNTLFEQARQTQISNTNYWMGDEKFSLYKNISDDRTKFPTRTIKTLTEHKDEVWFLEFSHDGGYLATASSDKTVIVWKMKDFSKYQVLLGHDKGVVFLSWSPDNKYLLSSSQDFKAILWEVSTGRSILTIKEHNDAVSTCCWLPNGREFITASTDMQMILWRMNGEEALESYKWTGNRIIDFAITPDGSKLIALCSNNIIHFYDLVTRSLITEVKMNRNLTCVSVSRDSKYALVNVRPEEIHLWDLMTYRIVRKYVGQLQREFIIRSCFGGAYENFILSGSQDNHVYVWNRQTADLIETLAGHTGSVNCVRWCPTDAMFASASDDKTVRIWVPDSTV